MCTVNNSAYTKKKSGNLLKAPRMLNHGRKMTLMKIRLERPKMITNKPWETFWVWWLCCIVYVVKMAWTCISQQETNRWRRRIFCGGGIFHGKPMAEKMSEQLKLNQGFKHEIHTLIFDDPWENNFGDKHFPKTGQFLPCSLTCFFSEKGCMYFYISVDFTSRSKAEK